MEESELLDKIYRKEKELQLDNELLKGVPLWRMVRSNSRLQYLTVKTGYVASTSPLKGVGPKQIKFFSGFWKYLFKKDLNMLFAFNRLVNSNGLYLDKFLDPVVEESFLKDEKYVIVDPQNYTGNYPRMHREHVISNERNVLGRRLFNKFLSFITPFVYKKKVSRLFNEAKDTFELPDSFVNNYYKSVATFLAEYYYYLFWLMVLHPRRVMVVYRRSYYGLIAACKRLSIPVAEFQHGVTLDKTVSYTGEYDCRIDPDYFFTFGNYWKSDSFGMTDERTICMGWAYGQLMKNQPNENKKANNVILAISSPEISECLLDGLAQLAKWNPEMRFHIRLHPSESYNEKQKEKLSKISQAEVVDNNKDSAAILPLYKYVIGENSSVLYEALSLGCRVGLLNICGLRPPVEKPGIASSFYVIDTVDNYKIFIEEREEVVVGHRESFYSEFDKIKFESFLNHNL